MLPDRNLLRRQYDNYGRWFGDSQQDKPYLRSNPMAEESSRPNDGHAEDEQGEADTSSKETDEWLQLGIGHPLTAPTTSTQRLSEVELFSYGPIQRPPLPVASVAPMGFIPLGMPMFSLHGLSYRPWGFWNQNQMMGAAPPTLPLQYSYRRFPCPPQSLGHPVGDMRVVMPPRRQQASVWFLLEAAPNQDREPFLPQIPRNFLRIKDERMTIRLLMVYMVRKLRLYDESEVEMTCRGELLHPSLTLQYVRDNIWRIRAAVEMLQGSEAIRDSSAASHVMIIQYGRSST